MHPHTDVDQGARSVEKQISVDVGLPTLGLKPAGRLLLHHPDLAADVTRNGGPQRLVAVTAVYPLASEQIYTNYY